MVGCPLLFLPSIVTYDPPWNLQIFLRIMPSAGFGLPSDVREAEAFARATGSLSEQGVDMKQGLHCCLLLVLHRLLRPHMAPVGFSQGLGTRSPSER